MTKARWCWDLNRIHAKGYTDNVVDLMVGKLNRLSAETQNALQKLACLGNDAEFTMLRIVYQDSEEEMHGQLWEAVRAGLIFRSEDSYKFLHDRVQEAAYSLIPEESRAEAHLRMGMLLAAQTPPEKLEETIFEIVNQLNRGSHLITSIEELERVAELNFIAGRRAKTSTAYASALNYLLSGAALLPEDSWERQHDLTFELELHRAECEFLTGALGGSRAAPGGAVGPCRNDDRTSPRLRACKWIFTRPWIRAAARSQSVSTISATWASTGRRIRRKTRSGANMSGSGPNSAPAR